MWLICMQSSNIGTQTPHVSSTMLHHSVQGRLNAFIGPVLIQKIRPSTGEKKNSSKNLYDFSPHI